MLTVVPTFVVIRLVIHSVPTETARVYNLLGAAEYNKGEFQNALSLITQGIDVKCKDDRVNAMLCFNKFTTHHTLGESVICCPLKLSELE